MNSENKRYVKFALDCIGSIIVIVVVVFACFSGMQAQQNQKDQEKQKMDIFIKKCLDSGKRINQIGDVFTGERIICNPK